MSAVLRLFGILSVFVLALLAWLTLGGVTHGRSSSQEFGLEGRVADLWGSPQLQRAPSFTLEWDETTWDVRQTTDSRGRVSTSRTPLVVHHTAPASPASTRVDVNLGLDERRKGLMWFPLYNVEFDGRWTYVHHGPPRTLALQFPFPDSRGLYDGFRFVINGEDVAQNLRPADGQVSTSVAVAEGDTITLETHYRSRGMSSWTYQPTEGVGQVEDFALNLHTDFATIDYPAMAMSPTTRTRTDTGWDLDWTFDRLVTGYGIGMVMPTHIQPGELASALSFSAPISLGLFFLWVYVLGLLKGIEIHPVNYLFIAAGFFAFNLLFAYTADHLDLEWAFAVASVVSVVLVASYLRLVVGARFALLEAGIAQLLYQVGFGVAHFFDGYTGLTITLLGIVTLFALMQLTGRLRWAEVLRGPAPIPAR